MYEDLNLLGAKIILNVGEQMWRSGGVEGYSMAT
jgi:hypothetical protein